MLRRGRGRRASGGEFRGADARGGGGGGGGHRGQWREGGQNGEVHEDIKRGDEEDGENDGARDGALGLANFGTEERDVIVAPITIGGEGRCLAGAPKEDS